MHGDHPAGLSQAPRPPPREGSRCRLGVTGGCRGSSPLPRAPRAAAATGRGRPALRRAVSRGTPVRSGCPPRGERALFTPALHAWPLAGRQGHSQGIRDDSGSVTGAVHGVLSAPGPWPAGRAPFLQGFIPNGPSQCPLRPAPEPGWTRSKESVTCHSPSTPSITSPHTCPRQATQAGRGSPPGNEQDR